ncbi:MAG: cytidylyltransferase domain-containing protein [Promethearchaeota archaeon]
MSLKKVGIIVQARMGSTRLPGKTLKKINNNETVLGLLIKRLKLSKETHLIIIATSSNEKNKQIIELAKFYNVSSFIGSEENVLERYYQAAKKFSLDIIIRITSDCPFVDPEIIDEMVKYYMNNNFDYIANTYPLLNIPAGFDVEIFSFEILENLITIATTSEEKEHVTYYIKSNPELFSCGSYNIKDLKRFDDLWLAIDYYEDLIFCREVYKEIRERGKGFDFSIYDIIELIEENPGLMEINKDLHR